MRNPILILLLITVSFGGYGQMKKTVTGDTTFWYEYTNKDLAKLKLPRLDTSTKPFYFRFSTHKTIVDIWSNDKKTFNGMVTSHINSYIPYNIKKQTQKQGKTFFKSDYLDTTPSRKAYELTMLVAAIPSDNLIKGWSQGFDGITYSLETATPTNFKFKKLLVAKCTRALAERSKNYSTIC